MVKIFIKWEIIEKLLAGFKIKSYVCSMKKGDKVRFLGTEKIIYDNDGNDVYSDMKEGKIYEVEDRGLLCIKVLSKLRLKEYFRKIENK